MTEGDARSGSIGCDLGPEDAQALLRAWLDAVDLRLSERDLLALLQSDGFSHAGLERRARRCHERRLEAAVDRAIAGPRADRRRRRRTSSPPASPRSRTRPPPPSSAARRASSPTRDHEPVRVALVADGIGGMHGVTHTIDEIRERGVPGFEVEVIGTDPHVDRRLSAVAEVEIPFYAGLKVGVPEPARGRRRARRGPLRRAAPLPPGPAGVAAAMIGRVMGLPIAGSYHTELAAYAALRSGDAASAAAVESRSAPSTAAATSCSRRRRPPTRGSPRSGIEQRIGRWDRGVDTDRFSPTLRTREPDGRVRVLYAGRLTREKGVDLLADAFLAARARDPRLELELAGGGPEEDALRARLGGAARFSAGSRARRWRAPTRTPTSSSSARRRTPSARWCSRRRPPGSRSSRWPRAARRS